MRVEWVSLEGKTNILEGIRQMAAPKGKDENEDYKIVETLLCQVNVKGVPLVSEFPHQRKDVSNQSIRSGRKHRPRRKDLVCKWFFQFFSFMVQLLFLCGHSRLRTIRGRPPCFLFLLLFTPSLLQG